MVGIPNGGRYRYSEYYPDEYLAPGTAQTGAISRNTTMPRLPTLGLSLEF